MCAASVVERLKAEGHEVLGFFYNPNIYPAAEYERRLEVARQVASRFDFPLADLPYSADEWNRVTAGLEGEPESGKRCPVCFKLRLQKTWLYMQEQGADAFTTTLTVGPSKSAGTVNAVGCEIGSEKFLQRDFKKKDGFKRSSQLAREWDLYRQHYCGCRYSLKQ